MKCDHETFINLYPWPCAMLDYKKEATVDSGEDNSTLLNAQMPQQQTPEQFNHFPVFVRGGMHQPVEE